MLEVETLRGGHPHTVITLGNSSVHPEPGQRGGGEQETRGKNRNGRTAFAVTAVPRVNRLETELSPPFFSSPPPLAAPPIGRAMEGPSVDSQAGWPSHLVRSRQRCESDRVADQPFALRSEALRRSG